MKRQTYNRLFSIGFGFAALAFLSPTGRADALADDFAAPPDAYGLQAWYHWTASFVTEKGLTADLEAMKEIGITAAHIFAPEHGTVPGNREIGGTDAWFDRVDHAAKEARRLGLALGAHNCPGWSSSGGPWIRPEDSMKVVVSSHVDTSGGALRLKLPHPLALRGFYHDIAVYAFPWKPLPKIVSETGSLAPFAARTVVFANACSPKSLVLDFKGIHLWGTLTVEASCDGCTWEKLLEKKVRYYRLPEGVPCILDLPRAQTPCSHYRVSYAPSAKPDRFPPHLTRLAFECERLVPDVHSVNGVTSSYALQNHAAPATPGIPTSAIRDLTALLAPDGTLAVTLPRDAWRIVRVGYTTTGAECRPAARGAAGLECDKLSRRGLDAHWPHLPARLLASEAGRAVFRTLTIDSYEHPGQNWTEDFAGQFAARRGYPLGPRLLSVLGYSVGTWGETAKFLYDYGRTVSDLFIDNYYAYFTELCHRNGLRSIAETYGGPFNMLDAFACTDIPAGEIWDRHCGECMSSTCRAAAFSGHVAGATGIVAAEAFTGFAPFARFETTPADLRIRTDDIWCRGVNQIVYHSYVHQPYMNVKPGFTLGTHGTQFNRHTTWWREAKVWTDYVRRGQVLLRAGAPCAEILAYGGLRTEERLPGGYAFDLVGDRTLLRLENLSGGCVGIPGEHRAAYPVLFVSGGRYMTRAALEKLTRLLDGGARIALRSRPVESPSLGEDVVAWKAAAERLFADRRLKTAASAQAAAAVFGVRPAVSGADGLSVIHRRAEERDIYFLANVSTNVPFAGTVTLAARPGMRPEIWDAGTGRRYLANVAGAPEAGRTAVTLDLPPTRSAFVVFSSASDSLSSAPPPLEAEVRRAACADLSHDWQVTFAGDGAPAGTFVFGNLVSWSAREEEDIRYFSGHALYRRTFSLTAEQAAARPLFLDLGTVCDAATVRVNGRTVSTLIEAPFAVDVAGAIRAGENVLEVEVVNSWPNRLIGDARARRAGKAGEKFSRRGDWPDWVRADAPIAGVRTWSTYGGAQTASEPLVPAGLLGPVVLRR